MEDRDDTERRTASLFDTIAAEYDASGVDFFQPIAAGLVETLEPRRAQTWLDIGCGRGAVLFPLAVAVDPGRVLGLDVAPAMLALARTTARERGIANVDFVLGSAQTPDPALGPFDGVASSLVLFFLPDPLEAVRAWLRLLRPGGRLGITTFGESDPRWREVDAVLKPYLPRRDARTSGAEGPFGSDAGMERLVEGGGFADARTISRRVPVTFAGFEQWLAFSTSTGQRAAWLAVPEQDRQAVRDQAASRLQSHAEADGSVTFEQEVRYTLAHRP